MSKETAEETAEETTWRIWVRGCNFPWTTGLTKKGAEDYVRQFNEDGLDACAESCPLDPNQEREIIR